MLTHGINTYTVLKTLKIVVNDFLAIFILQLTQYLLWSVVVANQVLT